VPKVVVAVEFRTVPDELLGVAAMTADWLKSRGFKVTPERHEIGYPVTPTLYGKRSTTIAIIEVDSGVPVDRMEEWAGYGRSRTRDTRVWCAVPEDATRTGKLDRQLKELGIGLILVDDREASEVIPARDLAVSIVLPRVAALPPRLQPTLGPVYDHFDRAEWREGFGDACLALEDAARKHLWKGVKAGRVTVLTANGTQQRLTKAKIDALTMGQLTGVFSRIVQQTHADRVIGDALKQVNPNRIGVAHHKRRATTEAKLRRDVGSQMWLIIGALKEIDGSP
jgi:hypothetical protein